MWGSLAAQPLVQWSGRAQKAVAITSLRQFGRGGAAGVAPPVGGGSLGPWAPPGATVATSSPPFGMLQQRGLVPWRIAVAQQLHTLADPAGPAAGNAACRIQPGEVHLWWLDPSQVANEAELQRCAELLTEEELQECYSSGDAAVRRERVLARAYVRSVLSAYLAGSPHPRSLLFERNSHGKPRLVRPSATPAGHTLRFNLTHTPSLIGLAVTADGLVGLDVEAVERRTRSDPMRLARRRFSQREVSDLEAWPEGNGRAAYFLQLWTLKEAYVKALGRGISAPPGLRSFSFRVGGRAEPDATPAQQQQQQQQQQAAGAVDAPGPQDREQPEDGCGVQLAAPAAAAALAELDAPLECAGSVVLPPQSDPGADLVHGSGSGNGGSSMRSTTSCEGGVIQFRTTAADSRRWRFALLHPAVGHVAALCVEDSVDACCGSPAADVGGNGQQDEGSLRLRSFTVHPASLLGSGCLGASAADPRLLAQGAHLPC